VYLRCKKKLQINQTLLKNFQSDRDEKFSSRLCSKFFNRTLPEKFQAPSQTLLKIFSADPA
jgi:hypothetical protein